MSSADGTAIPTLAVVGGGLAGIAAAEAAARKGFQVDLFEWSGSLGGRAASLFDPVSQCWIDNGQHLALGCCTEFLALNRRLGLDRFYNRYDTIPFVSAEGKRWQFAACRFLPKRWQLAPAFLGIPSLSLRDRLKTGLLLRKLTDSTDETDTTFADWLVRHRVSGDVVGQFWLPLLLSTLSETPENTSLAAVRKVVRDGFLAGKDAMAMYLPSAPLRTIYHETASRKLLDSGVRLHFHARVRRLYWNSPETGPLRIDGLETRDGKLHVFDGYILSVPSFQARVLLEDSNLGDFAESLALDRFEPGAITSIHLWFDRRLLPPERPYAALVGGPGQFLFCPERPTGRPDWVYHTVILSASHRLLTEEELTARGRPLLVERVVRQLRDTFPDVFHEKGDSVMPRHYRVTTFFNAVFSPQPSVYLSRPESRTPFSNLALAGDWTRTHWPSTFEGAVCSGLKAVETLRTE